MSSGAEQKPSKEGAQKKSGKVAKNKCRRLKLKRPPPQFYQMKMDILRKAFATVFDEFPEKIKQLDQTIKTLDLWRKDVVTNTDVFPIPPSMKTVQQEHHASAGQCQPTTCNYNAVINVNLIDTGPVPCNPVLSEMSEQLDAYCFHITEWAFRFRLAIGLCEKGGNEQNMLEMDFHDAALELVEQASSFAKSKFYLAKTKAG